MSCLFFSIDSFALVPSLESLILDENSISGGLAFLQQPSLIGLTHLNLDANQLTEINAEDFMHLRNLRSLLVNRNQLTDLNFLSNHTFKRVSFWVVTNKRMRIPVCLLS